MSAAQAETLKRIRACKQQSTVSAKDAESSYRTTQDVMLSRNFSAPVLSVSSTTRYVAGTNVGGTRSRGLIRRVDLSNALVRSFVCKRCRRSIPVWTSLVDLECAPTTQIHRNAKGGYSRTSRDHAFTDEDQRPPWDFVPTVAPGTSVPDMINLAPFLYIFNAVPVHMVEVAAELASVTPADEFHRRPAILSPLKMFETFADLEESPYCIVPRDMSLFGGISPLRNAAQEDWIIDMGRLYTNYILPNLDLRDFAPMEGGNTSTAPKKPSSKTSLDPAGDLPRVSAIQRDRPVWDDETRFAAHNTSGSDSSRPGYTAFLDESYDTTPLGIRMHSARTYGKPAAAFETAPAIPSRSGYSSGSGNSAPSVPIFVPFAIFARTSDVQANKDKISWGRARFTDAELAERALKRKRDRDDRRRYASLSIM